MKSGADAMISRAKTRMVVQMPFFGVIAWQMNYVEDNLLRTMATDCAETVYYSSKFFAALDVEDQCFGIAHELMHCISLSGSRIGDRRWDLWNCATDYVINAMLIDCGLRPLTMPQYLGPESKILHDRQYKGMTAEMVYDRLLSAGYKPSGHFDDHVTYVPRDPAAVAQSSRRMRRLFSEAMASVGIGNAPASLQRLYKDMCSPKIDWRSMLASVVSSCVADDYSFVPPDSGLFGYGITIPTISLGQVLKAIVIIDASGSIGDKDIAVVMAELKSLAAGFAGFQIKAFSFDAVPYEVQEFSDDGDSVDFLRIAGGGGTAFVPALEQAAKIVEDGFDADVVIFFTDGYGESWGEHLAHKFNKMVWILNNKQVTPPPWGESCVYDRHDL